MAIWSQTEYTGQKDGLHNFAGAGKNMESALSKQEGGNHYKDCAIQPIEYIHANDLDFFQGNIVKYVTRHKKKNGAQDLRKVIHYAELALQLQYGEKS